MNASEELLSQRLGTMGIIFGISLFAVSFPAISKRASFLPIPKIVFLIGKHFGTGVILSTAFCHLLKDSFQALNDPLVESRYPGVGGQTGFIILVSLLAIFLVEYISTSYVDHLHHHEAESSTSGDHSAHTSRNPSRAPSIYASEGQTAAIIPEETTEVTPLLSSSSLSRPASNSRRHTHNSTIRLSNPNKPHYLSSIIWNNPRHSRSSEHFYIINDVNHHIHNGEYHLVGGNNGCVCVCMCPASRSSIHGSEIGRKTAPRITAEPESIENGSEDDNENEELDHHPELSRKRQIVGILVLQMGIMIHSLVIGLTLAITSGSEFATLTTAIIFHQLFEGLSLGIRIAAIPAPVSPPDSPSSDTLPLHNDNGKQSSSRARSIIRACTPSRGRWLQPILSILFAVTTPAGICLGLIVFTANGKKSEEARMMLTQGLMSAISAGMLIYAATVEMLAADFVFGNVGGGEGHGHSHGEEFMPDDSDDTATWKKKVVALISLCAGVMGMGLIGLGE